MNKSDAEWQDELTPEQYHVLREQGTEKPFTGEYVEHDADGVYTCAGCGSELFVSKNKFDAHCGWPSFDDVINSEAINTQDDNSLGMRRIEVTCKTCGGHLGHVFPDGPTETTGLRYCINSVALNFKPKDE